MLLQALIQSLNIVFEAFNLECAALLQSLVSISAQCKVLFDQAREILLQLADLVDIDVLHRLVLLLDDCKLLVLRADLVAELLAVLL